MKDMITEDELLELLRHTLGSKVELIELEIRNQHHDYLVLWVQLGYPSIQVVVKVAGPAAPLACPFERTAMLHRLVAARTTIPMPEVLAVDVSYQTWPWRYVIKAHIPGQEWANARPQMNAQELSNALGQIGHAVAQLHAIRFPAFGELVVDGHVAGDEPYIHVLAERARRSIKNARSRELFFSVLEERKHLFLDVRQPGLCHEDLHQHNIIFRQWQGQWRLATILDLDKAWAGHHETDLARLEFWTGMTGDGFWPAYKAIGTVDPLYPQRRPIYQLLWCLEYARPTAAHLADTQRLCAELGLPRLERFD
jgi:aminoglycoside phosphotransferase (APT) family kinase protein